MLDPGVLAFNLHCYFTPKYYLSTMPDIIGIDIKSNRIILPLSFYNNGIQPCDHNNSRTRYHRTEELFQLFSASPAGLLIQEPSQIYLFLIIQTMYNLLFIVCFLHSNIYICSFSFSSHFTQKSKKSFICSPCCKSNSLFK